MNLKKMYDTSVRSMLMILTVAIVMFLVLGILVTRSQSVSRTGTELIELSNDVLHVNNYLVKLMRIFVVNHDMKVFEEYESILNDDASLNGKIERMEELKLSDKEMGYIEQLYLLLDELAAIEGQAIDAFNAGDTALAAEIIHSDEYISVDSRLADHTESLIASIVARVDRNILIIQIIIFAWLLLSGAIIIAAIVYLIKLQRKQQERVLNPLQEIQDITGRISRGDIDFQITKQNDDEIGTLLDHVNEMILSINQQCKVVEQVASGDLTVDVIPRSSTDTMNVALGKMVEDLNSIFHSIVSGAATVSAEAGQVAEGSHEMARSSGRQASSIGDLADAITDMIDRITNNTEMAGQAAELAAKIKKDAEQGSAQMDKMMQAVAEINEAGRQISNVIKAIDDIAAQTNMLSLNAAIEAARAGQHGKGFAVVAEEVRTLAAKSVEAAKDTDALIANSIAKAELGARIAEETAASLSGIVSGIGESSEIAGEIARISEQQNATIVGISRQIRQVADMVEQSSAALQESAAASERMSSQADLLQELVEQFKLKK